MDYVCRPLRGGHPHFRLFLRAAHRERGGGWRMSLAARHFDESFYRERNPDVAAAGIDPLAHYMHLGWREGRDPSPLFDTNFYLRQAPYLRAEGQDPWTHYLAEGWKAGNDPHPLFDTRYYLAENADVQVAGVVPLIH